MKILLIADREESELWDRWQVSGAKKLEGVDLIISAGDLSPFYLEFLVTLKNVPVLYVRGNHDSFYDEHPPLGCINIDEKVYTTAGGLRIAGLGGSVRYRDGKDMYTEKEMRGKIKRLRKFMRRDRRRRSLKELLGGLVGKTDGAGMSEATSNSATGNPAISNSAAGDPAKSGETRRIDILVTHAPCRGHGDMSDLAHRGFECFNDLLDEFRPAVHCYGHVHKEYGKFERELIHSSGTRLINGCGMYIFEI